MPLSVVSNTVPGSGDARFYQTHYRQASPYCTPATFNATNGLAVVW